MDDESVRLLELVRDGDSSAAEALYHRFVERLITLAKSRLSKRLTRRVDAEDVVQSVYRSFFVGAQDGRYNIERAGDLWRLLAAITVNKVLRQAEFHGQQKRDVDHGRDIELHFRLLAVAAETAAVVGLWIQRRSAGHD